MTATEQSVCLYGRGRDGHEAVDPVRVATGYTEDGEAVPAYACRPHAPAATVAAGGELGGEPQ